MQGMVVDLEDASRDIKKLFRFVEKHASEGLAQTETDRRGIYNEEEGKVTLGFYDGDHFDTLYCIKYKMENEELILSSCAEVPEADKTKTAVIHNEDLYRSALDEIRRKLKP